MSDEQLDHFRDLLGAWKTELMEEVDRTMLHMKDDAANFPDPNDRATQESEFGLELRTRDRERKLLKKNRLSFATSGRAELRILRSNRGRDRASPSRGASGSNSLCGSTGTPRACGEAVP